MPRTAYLLHDHVEYVDGKFTTIEAGTVYDVPEDEIDALVAKGVLSTHKADVEKAGAEPKAKKK